MRVLIDATSVLLRSAGVKNYTYHWIEHLKRIAPPGEIEAFPFLRSWGDLHHEISVLPAWATYPRLALLYFLNAPGNRAIDWLARGADLFHVSNQIRNPPQNVRLSATVHDLTCFTMPQLHTAANVRADRSFANLVLKRAHRLIAVSENTRQDAIRALDLDPRRIQMVYSGVAEAYFQAQAKPASKPYLLYVGAIEPRKNLGVLLDAWESSKPSLRDEFELLIVGATGWRSDEVLRRLRDGLPGLRYRGYVPERELPELTAGATAFIYPSLYEGFGFPVAQAMACGVPVITSNTSCLPEVAGDGAVYVDPQSIAEIAAAIERVLTSPTLRKELGERGRVRAQRYRWEECARQSLDFFREAAAN